LELYGPDYEAGELPEGREQANRPARPEPIAVQAPDPPMQEPKITREQVYEMGGLMKDLGWVTAHRQNWLKKHAGTIRYDELSASKAAELIKDLHARRDEMLNPDQQQESRQEALIG
jgi:hypothetical protein